MVRVMRNLLVAVLTLALLGGCMTRSGIPDDPRERLTSQTVLYIELTASGDSKSNPTGSRSNDRRIRRFGPMPPR
jgi:hypothetical protein